MTEKEKKLKSIDDILSAEVPYQMKLEAYEYLSEHGEEVVDEMVEKLYKTDGDEAQMLVEVLANFKNRNEVYHWLVTYFYRGEDLPLFAKLLGSYGDVRAIEILNTFADENELDYNTFMEVRNAVEQLGGIFTSKQDFTDDPYYRYLKGIDENQSEDTYEHMQECKADPSCNNESDDLDLGTGEKYVKYEDTVCDCNEEQKIKTHIHSGDCDCDDKENDCDCGDECGCGDDCDCVGDCECGNDCKFDE